MANRKSRETMGLQRRLSVMGRRRDAGRSHGLGQRCCVCSKHWTFMELHCHSVSGLRIGPSKRHTNFALGQDRSLLDFDLTSSCWQISLTRFGCWHVSWSLAGDLAQSDLCCVHLWLLCSSTNNYREFTAKRRMPPRNRHRCHWHQGSPSDMTQAVRPSIRMPLSRARR